MAWTRRQFLYRTTVLGAALGTGPIAACSSRVGGTPHPDPGAGPAAEASSTAPVADAVTIGVMNYQPYTVQDNGEITGPVPEVARAVLSQLGITNIKIALLTEEAQLLVGLRSGNFDLAGGLAIRPDLCADLAFSTPDYVSGTALIVPAGNPKGLATYADVVAKGAKVAVMKNLPEQGDAATARVPAARIVPLDSPNVMMQAVQRGQADCAAFDDLSARELVRSTGGALAVAAPFTPPGRLPLVGAYAFPKDKADLLEAFDNRLHDLHESGDWLGLVAPFGLTEDHVPPPDLTAEQACAG
jgi:polar amino acid transport system substrate-binding protein